MVTDYIEFDLCLDRYWIKGQLTVNMVTDYIEFDLGLDRYLNQGSTKSKHGNRLYSTWSMSR